MTTRPDKRQRTATAPATRGKKALPHSGPAGGIVKKKSQFNDLIKLEDSLRLDNTNWVAWQAHMFTMLQCYGVEGYVNETIRCPDPAVDLDGVWNWSCNDNFARVLISWNVTPPEQVHILGCDSAHEMWKNLKDVHGSGFKTVSTQWRKLFRITAGEGDDIVEHLDNLRQCGKQFEISDVFFNTIVAASLPPSWDTFTSEEIVGNHGVVVSPKQFISLIEREYRRREWCNRENIPT